MRALVLCFLKMPVNLAQYRVTVGVFNNAKSVHYEASLYSGMSNNLSNYCSSYSSLKVFFHFVLFLSKGNVFKIITKFCVPFFLFPNLVARVIVCLYSLLLILSGDAEINPGPLSNFNECFLICYWTLNSISVHEYSKLFLLQTYIMLYKFDIMCLPETSISWFYYSQQQWKIKTSWVHFHSFRPSI